MLEAFSQKRMRSFFGTQCLANGEQIWQKWANFSLTFEVLIIGEIEWQCFYQMMCAGNFSLGEKSFLKSTYQL